jgi:hypothetical protein
MRLLPALLLALFAAPAVAQEADEPRHFIFAGGSTVEEVAPLLADHAIEGVQILYTWKQLEPEEGRYDFSQIERDLAEAERMDRLLWVQLQDRFFLPTARNLPDYLLEEPQYEGGLKQQTTFVGEGEPEGGGWVAMQWNPALRARFQTLIAALAERFDGRIYGINLPETSADFGEPDEAFCDAYFEAELENILFARRAFEQSYVVQYINFFPCEWDNDHLYMERFFDAAVAQGIGLGGPDIAPYRRGQMRNSYPFFNRLQDELPLIAMAVQGATLTYTNPETGEKFTRTEFLDFATGYLGVDIIFWTEEAPWFATD